MKLFDRTFNVLEKAIDLRFKRHAVLSSNLVNSETPNFRAREFDFAGEIQKVMGTQSNELVKSHARHMEVSSYEGSHVIMDNSGAMGADGNNVDLDLSIGKVAANASSMDSAANYLLLKMRLLRAATRSGGGEA